MPEAFRFFPDACCYRVMSILFAALLATPMSAGEARLTSLTGETQHVEITSVDDQGNIEFVGGRLPLNELRQIEIPSSSSNRRPPPKPIQIGLYGKGVLFVESVSIADEVCIASGHGLSDTPIRLPIDLVQSIQLQPKKLTKSIIDSFPAERDEDQLVLLVDESIESVNGLIEKLDDNEVTFLWNEKSRTLPRKSLLAVGVASSGITLAHSCHVQFLNGCSLTGSIQSLKNKQLALEIGEDLVVAVDWSDVQRIDVQSDRLQFLADIGPIAFEHRPIVTSKRTWQKDRNVSGNKLKLGDRVYSKGIGVASYSRLEYQLDKEFATLCVTIGIDAETEGRGQCIFVVHGDGKELAREMMRATDDPRKLKIEINGIQKLELIVETGADLDLADHANWCDACLLRK